MTWWTEDERPLRRLRFDPNDPAHAGTLVTTRHPETGELMRCERCDDVAEFAWERLPSFTHGTGLRWCESCIPHAPAAGRTPEPTVLPRAA